MIDLDIVEIVIYMIITYLTTFVGMVCIKFEKFASLCVVKVMCL